HPRPASLGGPAPAVIRRLLDGRRRRPNLWTARPSKGETTMLIKRPRGWEIPEGEATPEHLVLGRRALMAAAGAGTMLAPTMARAQFWRRSEPADPWTRSPAEVPDLPPAMRNTRYPAGRDLSPER